MKKTKKQLALAMAVTMTASLFSPAGAVDAAAKPAWKSTKASLVKGKSANFTLKNVASSYKVTFSSSNKKIVKVKKVNNKKVKVTAVKKGTAKIKAVVKNKKNKKIKTLTKKVMVKNPTVKPTAKPTVKPTVPVATTTAPVATTTAPVTTAPVTTKAPTPINTTTPTQTPGVVDPTIEPTPTGAPSQDPIVDKVTITAVGRTWIEIVFPDAIDSSAVADNFKVTTTQSDIAATVTSAHWSTGYKTVRLNVTGLQYGLNYTIAFNGLKSAGVDYPVSSLDFKSSTVSEAWVLKIEPEREKMTADGKDNMKINFSLVDSATGVVDPNADEIVLELSTTYGNFQTTELVMQDGKATAVLRSDSFPITVNSKIHVEIKGTSSEYTFLKGTVSADKVVTMEAPNYSASGEARLTKAESGQADRITLYFDKEVTVASFVEYNKDTKEYKTEWVPASEIGWTAKATDPNVVVKDGKVGYIRQKLINNKKSTVAFTVTQTVGGKEVTYPVVGLNTVQGNSKALELVLHEAMPLNDNNKVYINYSNEKANIVNKDEFTLTDVKIPKFVSATSEGLKRVVLKFDEPIPALINQDKKVNDCFNVESGGHYKFKQSETTWGTFNPATLEDTRNSVVLTLDKVDGVQQYFQEREVDKLDSYDYQIAITDIVDYAGTSDDQNRIDANADNTFKVTGDKRKPEATVIVESPEQYRVSFNCPVTFVREDGETLSNIFQKAFKVDNGDKTGYVSVFKNGKYVVDDKAKIFGDREVVPTLDATKKEFFNVTPIRDGKIVADGQPADEFVVELTQDWTKVYKTATSNKNYYNDKFNFEFDKQNIINDDNGWKNDGITLDLNYAASTAKSESPMNKNDIISPAILDIQETSENSFFTVIMNEPIQYNNNKDVLVKSTNTFSETNTKLNDVTVQVQGKDPAGKAYTFNGIFRGYDADVDTRKMDTMLKLEIVDEKGRTLQDLVDEGYDNQWRLILHYTYDDVLNATDTVYKDFNVEPSEENVFQIKEVTGFVGATNDTVVVEFTKGVATNGTAVKPASWTLNGTKLSSAPIKVVPESGTPIIGYRKITITLPKGTLTAGKSTVIGVDQSIVSALGIELTGEHEITFVPVAETAKTSPVSTDSPKKSVPSSETSTTIK